VSGERPLRKKRADELVHDRNLCESRTKAQALIMAANVLFRPKGAPEWSEVKKAGQQLPLDCELVLKVPGIQDVGRGATKLRQAFTLWGDLGAKDALALDVGASTGGFTQVLLERGARRVVALDVGTHQLHERLRRDERVLSLEQTHVLRIDETIWAKKDVKLPFDLIVTDLSFISLTRIIEHVAPWLKPGGSWVMLIKPQFEVGPKKAPGGIVRNEEVRLEAIEKLRAGITAIPYLRWKAVEPSPIEGGDGNREFLLWVQRNESA